MKKNYGIMLITLTTVLLNKYLKSYISIPWLKWFMTCYFNDLVGGITFIAYCNSVFYYYKGMLYKLWRIELLLFLCGIFWEYITPLFRTDTISDPYDIMAYMCGGFIYWIIMFGYKKIKYKRIHGMVGEIRWRKIQGLSICMTASCNFTW